MMVVFIGTWLLGAALKRTNASRRILNRAR
jgi:hypothetical protein